MIRTIIVDDEILVKLGIKTLLEGHQPAISVVGAFSSGSEALEYLTSHPVGIVLLDIEMPDLSGLDCIKQIRERNLPCGIIIISCHDSFSYARDALDYGADAYLLKEELSEDSLVKKIQEVYQKRQSNATKAEQTVQEELSYLSNIKQFSKQQGQYYLGVLTLFCSYSGGSQVKYPGSYSMLLTLVEELLRPAEHIYAFMRQQEEEQIYLLFSYDEQATAQRMSEDITEMYQFINSNLKNYTNFSSSLAISDCFLQLDTIRQQEETAQNRLSLSFYSTDGMLYLIDKTDEVSLPLLTEHPKITEDGWPEKNHAILQGHLQIAKRSSLCPKQYKEDLLRQINLLLAEVVRYYAIQEDTVEYFTFQELDAFSQSDALLKFAETKLLHNRKKIVEKLKTRDQLGQILSYLDHHYQEPLTLESISGVFHMSPTYFSQYFSAKTNTTFIRYLNQLRTEKAKQLLLQQNLSMEEIAEEVGFSSANYLSRVFKKTTGQTLSEFRNAK